LSSFSKSPRYNERDVQFFCRWITERLRSGDIADVLVAVTSLQILLRRREYRPVFHAEDGVKLYVSPLCKLSLTVSVRLVSVSLITPRMRLASVPS
jgi:hypothetical protein